MSSSSGLPLGVRVQAYLVRGTTAIVLAPRSTVACRSVDAAGVRQAHDIRQADDAATLVDAKGAGGGGVPIVGALLDGQRWVLGCCSGF